MISSGGMKFFAQVGNGGRTGRSLTPPARTAFPSRQPGGKPVTADGPDSLLSTLGSDPQNFPCDSDGVFPQTDSAHPPSASTSGTDSPAGGRTVDRTAEKALFEIAKTRRVLERKFRAQAHAQAQSTQANSGQQKPLQEGSDTPLLLSDTDGPDEDRSAQPPALTAQVAAPESDADPEVEESLDAPAMVWNHDTLLALMPYTLSEKARMLFTRAGEAIRRLLTPQGDAGQHVTEVPEQVLPMLTVSGASNLAASEVVSLTDVPAEQVDLAGAVGFFASAPFELYGAAVCLVEFCDIHGQQDHALRQLILHQEGAQRFYRHHSEEPGSATPMPGDAESYRIFTSELKKLPDFYSAAKARRDSINLGMAKSATFGVLRSGVEGALAVGPLVKPFLVSVGSALNMASAMLGFIGSGLEAAEGVSNYDAARQNASDIAGSLQGLNKHARQYRTAVGTGIQKLAETFAQSLRQHFGKCANESEMDRRLALVQTGRGGLGLVLFGATICVLIAAAVGFVCPVVGIVLAVAVCVATIAFCLCTRERYRQIGIRARELKAMQFEAQRKLKGLTLADLADRYFKEMLEYEEATPGSGLYHRKTVAGPDTLDLENNPYYTLRFLALIMAEKIESRDGSQPGSYRQPCQQQNWDEAEEEQFSLPFSRRFAQSSALDTGPDEELVLDTGPDEEVALDEDSDEETALDANSAEKSALAESPGDDMLSQGGLLPQKNAYISARDRSIMEIMFDRLLLELGQSHLDILAMEEVAASCSAAERVERIEKMLAPVLRLPHV